MRHHTLNMLFTCVGRRIELVEAFRRAARALRVPLAVHGADVNNRAPALYAVDRPHGVPRIDDPGYVPALEAIIRRYRIALLIPTLDPDLPVLAGATDRLAQAGCRVVVSDAAVVAACRDKVQTHQALRDANIDTPATLHWTVAVAAGRPALPFPLFLKPRYGSAAVGNFVVRNADELRVFGVRVPDAIVQEFVEGVEHTLDVYCGLDGRPRCVVPRKRLEVRNGEVSKAVIVKDRSIMAAGRRVAKALGALGTCRGVVTVQCIVTAAGRIRVIEINPRFGGGAPLSIHAGADFPKWILQSHLGRRPRIRFDGFRDDVAMLRYDQSVFVPRASRRFTPRAPS